MYTAYGDRKVLDANFADAADQASDVDWQLGFQGLRHDPESGLVYQRARYNHVTLNRFVGKATIGSSPRHRRRNRRIFSKGGKA